MLSAAVLQALVTGGTVWLSGIALPHTVDRSGDLGSGCSASLSGALAAGLYPVHEPIARGTRGVRPLKSRTGIGTAAAGADDHGELR